MSDDPAPPTADTSNTDTPSDSNGATRRRMLRAGLIIAGIGLALSFVGAAVIGANPHLQSAWPEVLRRAGQVTALVGFVVVLISLRLDWLWRRYRRDPLTTWNRHYLSWRVEWRRLQWLRVPLLVVALAFAQVVASYISADLFEVVWILTQSVWAVVVLTTRGKLQAFCLAALICVIFQGRLSPNFSRQFALDLLIPYTFLPCLAGCLGILVRYWLGKDS